MSRQFFENFAAGLILWAIVGTGWCVWQAVRWVFGWLV